MELDRSHLQAAKADYHLKEDKNEKLIVQVKGSDVGIHDFLTGKDMERLSSIDLSLPVGTDGLLQHEYCFFRISSNELPLQEASESDIYFSIINNQRLVKEFEDMQNTEAAKNTTVINITMKAKRRAKTQAFLNKHMEMLLRDDLE